MNEVCVRMKPMTAEENIMYVTIMALSLLTKMMMLQPVKATLDVNQIL